MPTKPHQAQYKGLILTAYEDHHRFVSYRVTLEGSNKTLAKGSFGNCAAAIVKHLGIDAEWCHGWSGPGHEEADKVSWELSEIWGGLHPEKYQPETTLGYMQGGKGF